MKQKTLHRLIDQYLAKTATDEEQKLVETFLDQLSQDPVRQLTPEEEQAKEAMLLARINAGIQPPAKLVSITPWRKWAVAAIFIIIAGAGAYFLTRKPAPEPLAQTNQIIDIPPGRDAAILTLADGTKILLDSTTGLVTNTGGIQVINLNGQLTYKGATESSELIYNTITTARGNQYQLILEDGTQVWLNSASSLRYPVAFKGNERKVELTGEGYFEVAHNRSKPFYVKAGQSEVKVLGTHFNINSYADESAIRTTLLEGSVEVKTQKEKIRITPGQQAIIKEDGVLTMERGVDLDQVVAWKTGWFEFDNTTLPTIMRQISRWYDVDVVYEGSPVTETFGGRISKNVPLSRVLKSLERGGVQFQRNGKVVKVMRE